MKDNQVLVKLLPPPPGVGFEAVDKLLPQTPSANPDAWQGQRIVFPLRPDGKVAGSGTIQVTGQVVVGHTTQETTEQKRIQPYEAAGYSNVHRDGLGLYVDAPVTKTVPIYETRTERCFPGILTATGSAPVLGSTSTAFAAVANLAFGGSDPSAGKVPPPGLRMNGQYAGQSGLDIEFHPESAVVACREAIVARDYAVGIKGNQVLVNIQNGATPIVLEFRPDRTLGGLGAVEVSGRVLVGRSGNNDPVFQPKTDTCSLGVLTPAQRESARAATPTQPTAAPAPSRPSSASAPTNLTGSGGSAVLSLANGFATQPGVPNALAGRSFSLLRESLDTALTKAGFQAPPGMSLIRGWVVACSNKQPVCQQAIVAAASASGVAAANADANGNAHFPALPVGTYYVFGAASYNNQPLLWNLRVDLKPGANSVTLDQRNAAPVDR